MPFCAYCGAQVAQTSYAPCPSCGNPNNGAPKPAASGGGKAAIIVAVVAVGALMGLVVLGILAAIAIPNLLTATQRSKQKRTMADIRTIAVATEAYAADKREYPRATRLAELEAALAPTYIKVLPKVDGWGHELRYECWSEQGQETCDTYAIGSAAKDGAFSSDSLRNYSAGGATTNFNDDIIFSNGEFVQYPQGASR